MKKNTIAFLIIASALIWGGIIVACALELRGTLYKETVSNYLIGGVIAHLIFIWAPLAKLFKKATQSENNK